MDACTRALTLFTFFFGESVVFAWLVAKVSEQGVRRKRVALYST